MVKCLKDIKECRSTQVPLYDFKTNSRVEGEFTVIHPSDVVLLEGILVFYYKEVRDLFDMKLFVDTDADTRLARRGQLLFLLKILNKIDTKHDRLAIGYSGTFQTIPFFKFRWNERYCWEKKERWQCIFAFGLPKFAEE